MKDIQKKCWDWRERVHDIADEIAEVDRDFAQTLYSFCDDLDAYALEHKQEARIP